MKIESRQQLVNEIAEALAMRLEEGCFYLNLTEQEVAPNLPLEYVSEDCVWPHDGDEVIRIEPLSSHESYMTMEEYADMQPPTIADNLHHALDGRRPFARFKEALAKLNLLNDWYDFSNKWCAGKAEEWLHEEGVDFVDGKIVCSRETMIWHTEEEE